VRHNGVAIFSIEKPKCVGVWRGGGGGLWWGAINAYHLLPAEIYNARCCGVECADYVVLLPQIGPIFSLTEEVQQASVELLVTALEGIRRSLSLFWLET
jgi:hypothetical protein